MFSIFKGNNFYRASPETKCAAPHPRLTIHKVLASSDKNCRTSYPETKKVYRRSDGQTDRRTDAEGHNIKRPFFK